MNTTQPRLLQVETVGDLPVLWACLQRLQLVALLDQHFPTPPRWSGPLSCGEVFAVWLLFLTSQGDHCLNHLQPWVQRHHGTLQALLGNPLPPLPSPHHPLAAFLPPPPTAPPRRVTRRAPHRGLPQPTPPAALPPPPPPHPYPPPPGQPLHPGPARTGFVAVRP